MPGTSVDTIRAVPLHLTVPIGDFSDMNTGPFSDSQPGSPRSSLPSPSSPSGDSVSSFPSVSSSFIFSSQPTTPPQNDAEPTGHLAAQADDNSELIIPSLTLPSLVKRPTPYGQTLGDVKLIVIGRASSQVESEQLLRLLADEEYEDFVDVGNGKTFRSILTPTRYRNWVSGVVQGSKRSPLIGSSIVTHMDSRNTNRRGILKSFVYRTMILIKMSVWPSAVFHLLIMTSLT